MPDGTFNILALSGGGVRGVVQSRVLHELEQYLGGELAEHFDLFAGTSTGAIVALGLATGMSPAEITDFYDEQCKLVFSAWKSAQITKGPIYKADKLRAVLESAYPSGLCLNQLEKDVVIPTVDVDDFVGCLFTRDDHISVVDAAMASAAAPIFFQPSQTGGDRSFIDGGVWANDPSMVALTHALDRLHIPLHQIRLLSIGTGRMMSEGRHPTDIANIRPLSLETLRYIVDVVSATQSWHVRQHCQDLLGEEGVITLDVELAEWISLDDWKEALRVLPQKAEKLAQTNGDKVKQFLCPDVVHEPTSALTELTEMRKAMERVTKKQRAEFEESLTIVYTVGKYAKDDIVDARRKTHILDGPMRWRAVSVAGRTAPPRFLSELDWRAQNDVSGQQLEVVGTYRSDSEVRAAVFFDEGVSTEERLEWSNRNCWPGLFDHFRRTGEDHVKATCDSTKSIVLTVVFRGHGQVDGSTSVITENGDKLIGPRPEIRNDGNDPQISWHIDAPEVGAEYILNFWKTSGSRR